MDGVALNFKETSHLWRACERNSQLPATSIGVSIHYRYQMTTPLAFFLDLVGVHEIAMTDSTVMALQPGQ